MALEAQRASPSPSPSPRAADGAPAADPTALTATGDEWPDPENPPAGATPPDSPPADLSTAVVVASRHHASAAKYVPPRAASRTADPDPGRDQGWYSWSGRRSAPPPRRSRPDPPPPRRQRPAEVPPPQPPRPAPVRAPAPAPAPPPPPPPAPAPASPPPTRAQVRSADRVVPNILSRKRRAAAMQRTALVARGAAAGLCLAALAVLAADTRKGWALDSYSNYTQFRYSEAVNVIGFVYSVFQFAALVGLMRKDKDLVSHPKRDLFDFTMDQILFEQDCWDFLVDMFKQDFGKLYGMTLESLLNIYLQAGLTALKTPFCSERSCPKFVTGSPRDGQEKRWQDHMPQDGRGLHATFLSASGPSSRDRVQL